MNEALVTVIIPTLCNTARSQQIIRAINSVIQQQHVSAIVNLVVNGNHVDTSLLAKIESMDRVNIYRIQEANVSKARHFGRQHVNTPFFFLLDDDDELQLNALEKVLKAIDTEYEQFDLVIADAYNEGYQSNMGFVSAPELIERDPLDALLKENWLHTGTVLFRTASIAEDLFIIEQKFNELTILAYKIAKNKVKLKILNEPLAIIHYTEISASKSKEFLVSEVDTIRHILSLGFPEAFHRKLKNKLSSAYHNCSALYLSNKEFIKSLNMHFRSLMLPGGWRYFFYVRHILFASLSYSFKSQ